MAYLAKKIEQAHVVWFEESNQWVQFDEQQWLIFCFYTKGFSREDALNKFGKRFSLPQKQAKLIVENAYNSIHELFHPDFNLPNFSENTLGAASHSLLKKKTHKYCFNSKVFRIVYGSPFLEKYIHLPLAHLECNNTEEKVFTLEVFPFEDRNVLRINGLGGKCFSAEEPGQLKRLLYVELTNFFFDKKEEDWMSFMHASALKKNDEVIILTSSGGSGKSTMAGFLQLNGFEFFSDDFVPLEAKSKKVFPFPAALCAKNDAISLLSLKGLKFQENSEGKTAYAKSFQSKGKTKGYKISKVVFIKYNKGKDLSFKTVPVLDALYLFLQEAWVANDMIRVKKFISWFTKMEFYKLEYGNSKKAIEVLGKLMERR